MSFGVGVYVGSKSLDISSGWYPIAFKGQISITAKYPNRGGVSKTFPIPDGCMLFVQSVGSPSAHTSYNSFGDTATGYIMTASISGSTVTLRQLLWYGYAGSPLNGRRVTFNVFAYYPVDKVIGSWGALFRDGGVATALNDTSRLNVLRKKIELVTSSGNFTRNTGVNSWEPAPSVYMSDTAHNAATIYVYKSGDYWVVNVRRSGGRYYNGGGKTKVNGASSGRVRIAVFGLPPQSVPSHGLAIYGKDGGVAFSSLNPPEMPRGFIDLPSPSGRPNISSRTWSTYTDNAPQQVPTDKKIMYQPKMLGTAKMYYTPLPLCTQLRAGNTLTCGVLKASRGGMPVGGSSFGYWGEKTGSPPIPYIYEDDYF